MEPRAAVADEIAARKRAERKAAEAVTKSKQLEARVKQIEKETNDLRQMLAAAKEGLGVMKTIARIRQAPAGKSLASSRGKVGFDAVSEKIDQVTSRVNRKVKSGKWN